MTFKLKFATVLIVVECSSQMMIKSGFTTGSPSTPLSVLGVGH